MTWLMPVESKEQSIAANIMRLQSMRTFVMQWTQAYIDFGTICDVTDGRQARARGPRSFRMAVPARGGDSILPQRSLFDNLRFPLPLESRIGKPSQMKSKM